MSRLLLESLQGLLHCTVLFHSPLSVAWCDEEKFRDLNIDFFARPSSSSRIMHTHTHTHKQTFVSSPRVQPFFIGWGWRSLFLRVSVCLSYVCQSPPAFPGVNVSAERWCTACVCVRGRQNDGANEFYAHALRVHKEAFQSRRLGRGRNNEEKIWWGPITTATTREPRSHKGTYVSVCVCVCFCIAQGRNPRQDIPSHLSQRATGYVLREVRVFWFFLFFCLEVWRKTVCLG